MVFIGTSIAFGHAPPSHVPNASTQFGSIVRTVSPSDTPSPR